VKANTNITDTRTGNYWFVQVQIHAGVTLDRGLIETGKVAQPAFVPTTSIKYRSSGSTSAGSVTLGYS
jgi:hypothetical protein